MFIFSQVRYSTAQKFPRFPTYPTSTSILIMKCSQYPEGTGNWTVSVCISVPGASVMYTCMISTIRCEAYVQTPHSEALRLPFCSCILAYPRSFPWLMIHSDSFDSFIAARRAINDRNDLPYGVLSGSRWIELKILVSGIQVFRLGIHDYPVAGIEFVFLKSKFKVFFKCDKRFIYILVIPTRLQN